MRHLPSLKVSDRYESRFLLFDKLPVMWEHAKRQQQEKASSPSPEMVVIDANVMKFHRERVEEAFPAERCRYFEVQPGEQSKSEESWKHIIDFAFSDALRRNTPLVAIGGGVTGDLAGFAASTLMRGLPLYQVPTTLLAMVDSAVGGKTGINHPYGKNTIGTFYQPETVLFDTGFLGTLPQREWLCGISEVLKYGFIHDKSLVNKAIRLADPKLRKEELLQDIIVKSVKVKADIVASDARESGVRAYLNFGHTFAHALETLGNYDNINHGEAVYTGMIAALYISKKLGAPVDDRHLLSLSRVYNLDLDFFADKTDQLVSLMKHDKKNRDHAVQLILLKDYGAPYVKRVENEHWLTEAWNYTFDRLKKHNQALF